MAHPLAVNNIIETTIVCVNQEQASENIVHYLVTSVGVLPATDLDAAVAISDQIQAQYKAILGVNTNWRGVGARILNQIPTFPMAADTAAQGPGTVAGNDLPRQTCGITSWLTNFAGRSQRGRLYAAFPPVAADTGDGVPTVAYLDNLATLAGRLLSFHTVSVAGRTAEVALALYHRKTKLVTQVIDFNVRPKWATQRRRGSYGRANPSPF